MVRPCTPADEGPLLSLWETFDDLHCAHSSYYFRPPTQQERMDRHRRYLEENSFYLLYEYETRIAGFICGGWRQTPQVSLLRERFILELHGLCVSDEFRGRGFAKALIGAAVQEGRKRGVDDMEVHIWEFNTAVKDLMRDQGFRLISGKYGLSLGEE